MRPTRKNHINFYNGVNAAFGEAVKNLFIGEYHGTKCTLPLIVKILLFAACSPSSMPAAPTLILIRIPSLMPSSKFCRTTTPHQRNTSFATPEKTLARHIAIDIVLIPYHGLHYQDENEVYRSQAKSGTSHFHAYATACIVHKGLRYTVAIVPVAKGTAMKTVVQQLLKQCRSIGLKCSLLLLDRGFYSVETLSYLKRIQQPFLMPLVIRGKRKSKKQPAGGTRKYTDCKTQMFDRYELKSVRKVDADWMITKAKLDICIYCKNTKGKNKKKGRQAFAFVYNAVHSSSAKWFFETYRKRFGIEATYRQSHQCRIQTSTRNPLLRLFYFALSMILRNLWIWFELEALMNGKYRKQKTSEYCSLKNFRDENCFVKLYRF